MISWEVIGKNFFGHVWAPCYGNVIQIVRVRLDMVFRYVIWYWFMVRAYFAKIERNFTAQFPRVIGFLNSWDYKDKPHEFSNELKWNLCIQHIWPTMCPIIKIFNYISRARPAGWLARNIHSRPNSIRNKGIEEDLYYICKADPDRVRYQT